MWLATKHGFFSIVRAHAPEEKNKEHIFDYKPHPNLMMIRARKHSHLANLKEIYDLPEILKSKGTDYLYRIMAPREDVMALIEILSGEIDYTNFKNEVKAKHPEDKAYLSFLMDVWSLGLSLTPERFRDWFHPTH